jgi:hypothetical protein
LEKGKRIMPFKYIGTSPEQTQEQVSQKPENKQPPITGKQFKYLGPEPEESMGKSIARTLYQIPSSAAQLVTAPIDMLKAYPQAQAIEDYLQEYSQKLENEPDVTKLKEMVSKGYDREAIRSRLGAAEKVSEAIPIPTQSEAEKWIEKKTGLPLTPKTEFQKGVRTSTQTAIMAPGSWAIKLGAATFQPLFQKYNEALGIDKDIAEPVSQGMAILWALLQKGKVSASGIEEISKILEESKPPSVPPSGIRPTPPGERPEISVEYPGEYEYGEQYIKEPFKEATRRPEEKAFGRTFSGGEPPPPPGSAAQKIEKSVKFAQEEIPQAAKERFIPKPPELPKPPISKKISPITGKPVGRERTINQIRERDERDRLAIQQLGISPETVSPEQRARTLETLRNEGLKLAKPPEATDKIGRMVQSVNPVQSGNLEDLGNNYKNLLNQRERDIAELSDEYFTRAREATDEVIEDATGMAPELQRLYESHRNSSDPVMVDIAKEANKLLHEIAVIGEEGEIGEPIPVSFSFIIRRIQELRSGSKHKFANDPQNAYGILTDIAERELDRAEGISAEAVGLWRDAKDYYRHNYAHVFKNPMVFDVLNQKDLNYGDIYKKLTKPSIYNLVEPELSQSAEGQRVLDAAKRDIIENKFNEAFGKKETIRRNDVEDVLDDIGIHTTPEERTRIYDSLRQSQQETEAAKIRERRGEAKLREKKFTKPEETKPVKPEIKERKYKDIRKKEWWRHATSAEAASKMDIIDGLKIAKQMLPEEKYAKLAHAAGIRRIMNKKVPDESIHTTMEKMLKNKDDLEYIEYSLGKDTVKDFEKRIEDVNKYNNEVKEYEIKIKQIEKQEATAQKKEAKAALKAEKEKLNVKIKDNLGKKVGREITHRVLDTIPYFRHAPREMKSAVAEKLFPKK